MRFAKNHDTYVIRLIKGEEVLESLQKFCKEKGISGGYFSGLGGSDNLDIGYFDHVGKKYENKNFSGGLFEVMNVTGDISADKLHVHITIADSQHHAFGGHLFKALVNPTLEIFLTPLDDIKRFDDKETGLMLMDLEEEL